MNIYEWFFIGIGITCYLFLWRKLVPIVFIEEGCGNNWGGILHTIGVTTLATPFYAAMLLLRMGNRGVQALVNHVPNQSKTRNWIVSTVFAVDDEKRELRRKLY